MRAKKRFGQHFLHDRSVVERIVATLAPQPGQLLIEIGPGRGALTHPVLHCGVDLQAIEIDRDLSAVLRAPEGTGNLEVHNVDALCFDFATLATAARRMRLFGNLAYNIATELLFRLLLHAEHIRDMHFMLQKEVAQRLVATPGTKVRGRLSVTMQAWCEVELLFSVPPGAFSPPPAVDSAFVRLVPRDRPELGRSSPDQFAELVRRAFQQRRKTLRNTLRGCLAENQIRAAGVDPGARAETLSNAQFVKLAEQIAQRATTTGSQS